MEIVNSFANQTDEMPLATLLQVRQFGEEKYAEMHRERRRQQQQQPPQPQHTQRNPQQNPADPEGKAAATYVLKWRKGALSVMEVRSMFALYRERSHRFQPDQDWKTFGNLLGLVKTVEDVIAKRSAEDAPLWWLQPCGRGMTPLFMAANMAALSQPD